MTPRITKAILGLVATALCSIQAEAQSSATVDLTMVAPWKAPNFIIEIAETLATQNKTAYLDLLPHFVDLETTSSLTAAQVYNRAVEAIAFLGTDTTQLFKASLAIHEAAPRIEAYYQHYRELIVPALNQTYEDTCGTWILYDQQQFCQLESFISLYTETTGKPIELFSFDHQIHSTQTPPVVALYTDRFSNDFKTMYQHLNEANIPFVIRYKPFESTSPLYLTGYGVELALKKTDYLVIDDRSEEKHASGLKNKWSNMGKKIGQTLFQMDKKAKIEPLTPAEIKKLGTKAAQFVATSAHPLETLIDLAQDFPRYAKSISQVQLNSEFEQEIMENQQSFLRAGLNAVWLNGRGLEFDQIDPFYLLRAIRSERTLIRSFEQMDFTAKQAIHILSHPSYTAAERTPSAANSDIYDVRDTLNDRFVTWWNDLEKDKKYSKWTDDMEEFLRPSYPGQLPPIKKNIFNLIMVEDLANMESLARVAHEVQAMVKRLVPIRFGIVCLIKEDDSISTIMAKALNYLNEEFGKSNGMKFLTMALEKLHGEGKSQLDMKDIQTIFDSVLAHAGKPKSQVKHSLDQALQTQASFAQSTRNFLNRMSIQTVDMSHSVMFINGKLIEYNEERNWIQLLMAPLSETQRAVQHLVYSGRFTEGLDFYDFVLSQPRVVRQRNSYVTPTRTHPLRMQQFESPADIKYITKDKAETPIANLWIFADLNTIAGLKLVSEALSSVDITAKANIALIHSPTPQTTNEDEVKVTAIDENQEPLFSDVLGAMLFNEQDPSFSQIKEIVDLAIENYADSENTGNTKVEAIIPGSPTINMEAKTVSKRWIDLNENLQQQGIQKGFFGLVLNGRVIGPFEANVVFNKDHFSALFDLEYTKRISPVAQAIEESGYAHKLTPDVLSRVATLIETDKLLTTNQANSLENDEPVYRHRIYNVIQGVQHSRLVVGNCDTSFLEIGVIIDPLSEDTQRWAPILQTLSEIEGVCVALHLNPTTNLEELPIKRFYRYVFDKELHFDSETGKQTIPVAYFADLPMDPLYTLGVETNNAWHVTVREANTDLDNIMLSTSSSGVSAVYELESILLEGHCLDASNKSPPRGLEFEITSNHAKRDTLVMANLGYFQLKALPGFWHFGLRQGRSFDVYSIQDVGTEGRWNWNSHLGNNYTIAITSFEGLTIMPLVRKNAGMEHEDVLGISEVNKARNTSTGIWSSLSNKLFGKKHQEVVDLSKPKQADINVFSVASGKLYERFLSIMMASVMKHTESTVKFWFIENFLSPEFKDFVPHMAKQYGFDYEMVTYKWPSWLRGQQEKQRTIWGYKILFLDVLFPLSLDKVIFVDADQIVRTDLKELIDMDLKGAPYGYTPFCSDRTEMDGFRFWKEGYWKNHLRGKPYHISALYVVDLVRFRQMAAGDRLRAQYQQLSADPGSLANLDQDLPNNMQHMVPIFSLPQEWLWCETWCSDESLKKAKTIDLCNNPLTKEPKLDRARRQVPEWETYDKEIDSLRQALSSRANQNQVELTVEKSVPIKDEL
ncbi:UDP-glucose:glycoprotein glucosyltransferase-domain-containing protein [Blakeslea trispora]|nr:UDP-glucose:glycoprotein glucosyltransferase-domain-containing protein [Blakeslea trispora]